MKQTGFRLADIVVRLGGHVLGDADTLVNQVATLDSAQAGQLTFLASGKYRTQLAATRAGAIIIGAADAEATQIPRIVCNNPYAYFAKVSALLNPATHRSRNSPKCNNW